VVGRIDEALKRASGATGAAEPATAGQLFKPAWSVEEAGDRSVAPERQELPPAPVLISQGPGGHSDRGLVRLSSQWKERLAAGPDSDVALTEQFRRLAATLHHAHQANGLNSLMLTSASPGDGKTLTSVNLALVLASSYRYRVLLIDADLRRPSIPNLGGPDDGCGLSDALISATERKLALIPITPRLTLLPAGPAISNSIEALTSPRMRQILDEATSRFDWVVLDAPPVGPTTDARLLSQMVGGTLFVIHAGKTQCPDVQKAVDAIGRKHVLGVVLNGVEAVRSEAVYYGAT
jgi:capsular exopolysaccharide synthesis family protein